MLSKRKHPLRLIPLQEKEALVYAGEDSDRYQVLRGWGYAPGREVLREGEVIHRQTGPWARAVHSVLRHLEAAGFAGAPRVVSSGFDDQGLETLTFIEGQFMHPGPWTPEGATGVGRLLRDLHDATASYCPAPDAMWRSWFGRDLGSRTRVIGHCDAAPWNIVALGGLPVALIDWDFAGPVDPLVDLAQACWLNAKLHSDDVAERESLPPLADRARQLRAIVDGYGLTARQRRGFVQRIIEFAVHSTAAEADEFGIGPYTTAPAGLWGMAWRARSAAWMLRHRFTLQNELT